jgi:hypothetical protein
VAELLRQTAAWQGLGGVEVRDRGDLADAMAIELGEPLLARSNDPELTATATATATAEV